jgi:hypothetical protein
MLFYSEALPDDVNDKIELPWPQSLKVSKPILLEIAI